MKYNFDEIVNRRGTRSIKWDLFSDEELPMWVADMDFKSPQPVIDALHERVSEGVFGYTLDSSECKQSVVDWVKKRHQWEITTDDVVFVPGVVVGFNLAIKALTSSGENVVFQTPAYGPFFRVAKNHELNQLTVPLVAGEECNYEIDYEDFEKKISAGPGVFLLCNPQNPTGRVFTEDELRKMGEICLRHGVKIVSDEIHSDLIHQGNKHIPIAKLSSELADNTITLIAPSKTFNVAGLDGSIAIITNPELRKKYEESKVGLVGSVNLLAKIAMCACYREGEEWLTQLLAYLDGNIQYMKEFFEKELPEIKYYCPQGTFLAWLDVRDLNLSQDPDDHYATFFRNEAKVVLNSGNFFCEEDGDGFARLNFGCPRPLLMEGLNRMKSAVKGPNNAKK
jgi:cystathionine beta-lyase